MDARVTLVVLTHNRVDEVCRSVARACAPPSPPRIVVVDNASRDGTAGALARRFPAVTIVRAAANLGAAGRNLGLREATTPYVALADDDTWWTPSGLRRAADLLDRHPDVAVVSARVLVGPSKTIDATCLEMAASPLPRRAGLPYPRLVGFMAGASMVRREAVLAVGGFEPRLFLGSEEALLAADLASAGWSIVYADEAVVHHEPSRVRDAASRRRLILRNDLWFAWRRRPLAAALARTLALARRAVHDREARAALCDAVRGVPWSVRTRRRLPRDVEADWRALEARRGSAQAPVRLGLERVGVSGAPGARQAP